MALKSTNRSGGGDQFSKEDHAGNPLVIEVLEFAPQIPTAQFGPQDAVKVNIFDLSTKESFKETLLFGSVLVDRLKGEAGSGDQSVYTLGKPEGKRYWSLFAVEDDVLEAAGAAVLANKELFTQAESVEAQVAAKRAVESGSGDMRAALEAKIKAAQSK